MGKLIDFEIEKRKSRIKKHLEETADLGGFVLVEDASSGNDYKVTSEGIQRRVDDGFEEWKTIPGMSLDEVLSDEWSNLEYGDEMGQHC